MTATETLLSRNAAAAETYAHADLPPIPRLNAVVVTCADARVDPAHFAGLDVGEALVMRNTGGRITREVIEELASLAFLAAKMQGVAEAPMEVVIVHHTMCGAQRMADPAISEALHQHLGIDVSEVAIHDHDSAFREDLDRLRDARAVPGHVVVSALLYDVKSGRAAQVFPPTALCDLR